MTISTKSLLRRKAEIKEWYDIDPETGFMPKEAPLQRLPEDWNPWEELLSRAVSAPLHLGNSVELGSDAAFASAQWRQAIREIPLPSPQPIMQQMSQPQLRRARHVLTFLLHFYVHSHPPPQQGSRIRIPPSISVPLKDVSHQLDMPLVMTYSDNVLYNWSLARHSYPEPPSLIDDLRCLTTFTGTPDEEHFYLVCACIEVRGAPALNLMHYVSNEILRPLVGTVHRPEIEIHLKTAVCLSLSLLVDIIHDLTGILLSIRDGCSPSVFYHKIRPWLTGTASQDTPWFFEGIEGCQPHELAGSSAGQSALIHALDAFLGVECLTHAQTRSESSRSQSDPSDSESKSFLERMRAYMPPKHRFFLSQLSADREMLRFYVQSSGNGTLIDTYNRAVVALKHFRDAHIRVATLYIVNQASALPEDDSLRELGDRGELPSALGTGGTRLIPFLKGIRDMTSACVIPSNGKWTCV